MAYPVLTGAILIKAVGAALNMSGTGGHERTENVTHVKQIKVGSFSYPYVSGQAWRRWLREVLYADFGWKPSTVIREEKKAQTEGDPIAYEEDDIFGYMLTCPKKKDKRSKKSTTESEGEESKESGNKQSQKRFAPLKNSILVGILPNTISTDYGHFSRNLKEGEDSLIFEHEHYTNFLQGCFTLSLTEAGRFQVGESRDISEQKVKEYESKLVKVGENSYALPVKERIRRIQDVLRAISRLRYGAQLTRNLTDVTPVVTIIGFLDGGNSVFQDVFAPDYKNAGVVLNLDYFKSIVDDYKENLLKVSESGKEEVVPILIGFRPSVLSNEKDVFDYVQKEESVMYCGTPKQAFLKAVDYVEKVMSSLESA